MDFVTPPRNLELSVVGGRGHYDEVVGAVRSAELSVWISTANLKELLVRGAGRRWRSILEVFDELAGRGVELRILHAAVPSRPFRERFDALPRLVEGGLALRLCPRVHFKTVIVDASLLYLGSANWTGAGLGAKGEHRRNFELGVITRDELLIDQVQAYFDGVWSGRSCPGCRLVDVCEGPLGGCGETAPAPARRARRRRALP
jgi:phosphatidylserine/phosphatidylglycerophosphate/cardiolipin synthase-like enzyme